MATQYFLAAKTPEHLISHRIFSSSYPSRTVPTDFLLFTKAPGDEPQCFASLGRLCAALFLDDLAVLAL